MGAWGYGIFDDDTAYDFTDDIKTDARAFFKSSFEYAIETEYLEFVECHKVTVSAAYMDNFINGTTYRTDLINKKDESNVNNFGALHKGLNLDDLTGLAIKALAKVIGEKSELNELWSENEELYPKWKKSLHELIDRLK